MTDESLDRLDFALRRRGVIGGAAGLALTSAFLPDEALANTRPAAYDMRHAGVHISAGGVGNTTYKYGIPHAYRFRAEKAGYVTRVRWWNRFNMGDTGYSSGNGGTLRVELQTNSNGSPSGQVLGYSSNVGGLSIGRFPTVTLSRAAYLVAGQIYHLVFHQLSRSGWVSVNDLHFFTPQTPRAMYWGDVLASLTKRSGGWAMRSDRHPIFDLIYADGQVKGQGYMNAGRSDAKYVGGSGQVRQNIRMPFSRSTSQVSFRCWKTTSSGGMRIYLESSSGSRLASSYVGASEVSTSSGDRSGAPAIRWVTKSWDRAVSLSSGQTYRVRFEPAGGTFGFIALQKGWAWGFQEDKQLPRGVSYAGQYSTNGGRNWSGWTMYGRGNRDDLDIPVLLTLA